MSAFESGQVVMIRGSMMNNGRFVRLLHRLGTGDAWLKRAGIVSGPACSVEMRNPGRLMLWEVEAIDPASPIEGRAIVGGEVTAIQYFRGPMAEPYMTPIPRRMAEWSHNDNVRQIDHLIALRH